MTQSNLDVALALIPPGCPHVPFDRFSTLIPPNELKKIEATLSLAAPNSAFRELLLPLLWRFYVRALSGDEMASRKALREELQEAAKLADQLEILATRIWRSSDPAIIDLLAPFGAMFQEWQLWHPSGIAWIGLLRDFGLTTKLLADTLTKDAGGPRPALAFNLLMLELAEWHRGTLSCLATKDAGGPRLRPVADAECRKFLASVWQALRKAKPALRIAEQDLGLAPVQLKLPESDDALRKKLELLELWK
jgi:hypothetical protein